MGFSCHTISTHPDEIIKTKTKVLETIIISMIVVKVRRKQYDSRRKNEFAE